MYIRIGITDSVVTSYRETCVRTSAKREYVSPCIHSRQAEGEPTISQASAQLKKVAPAQRRDKLEIALERSSIGLDVGARLRDAARAHGNAQALADSYLITESAILENYFLAPRMRNEFNEEYEGLFTLASLSTSRLCPNYIAECAHDRRKQVRAKVSGAAPRVGCTHKMVTLTKPKLVGAGVEKDFEVFDGALIKLRKAKWWVDHVLAAVKGEEVTLGDNLNIAGGKRQWDFRRDGYHVHAHLLVHSKYLDWKELGELWKRCLESAAEKHGVKLEFNTSHGRPIVDIRKIKPKAKHGRDMTEDAAVFEVCKYVVKGSEFARVPSAQLLELDRVLRGRRMVEFWGEYNNRKGYGRRAQTPEASESREAAAYLDEKKQLTAEGGIGKPKKTRARPLRQIGAEMCEAGHEKGWAETVQEVGRMRREWRKSDLIVRYPSNIFYRVDAGEVLYGLSANPACAFNSDSLSLARFDFRYDLGERVEEFEAAQASERAAWFDTITSADRTQYRSILDWQERERWFAYVNHGPDALTGDETLKNRRKWNWERLSVLNSLEENEQRAARAFSWELSGKMMRERAALEDRLRALDRRLSDLETYLDGQLKIFDDCLAALG